MPFGLDCQIGRSLLTLIIEVMLTRYRYGCGSVHHPYYLTLNRNSTPELYIYQRVFNLYYLMPPGQHTRGDYTPQVFLFEDCTVGTLRSMIINSLPSLPPPHSIEFLFDPRGHPECWTVTSLECTSPILLEEQAGQTIPLDTGSSIVVSIKAPNGPGGSVVPIYPFPSPASPPRVLAWTSSCLTTERCLVR